MDNKTIVIIIIAFIIFCLIVYGFFNRYIYKKRYNPLLLSTAIQAKSTNTITNSKIYKSTTGIQFTYSFWIYIHDLTYLYDNWKSILVKKDAQTISPGIWLHPTKNSIKIELSTLNKTTEELFIEDIPLQKWIFMSVTVNNRNLDVFIDGELVKSKRFVDIPVLNLGNITYGGFNGQLTNIRYFNRALFPQEIKKLFLYKRKAKTLWWLYL